MYPLRFIGYSVSLSGVFKRCQVCFFFDLIAFSPLWFTSTSVCCLCFALGRGPTRQIALKVEGRADVHIGIRDSIVHIDIGDTRLRAIVRIATTKHQTEARTSRKEGSSLLLQSYTKYVKVYQRTEKFSDRFAVERGRPTVARLLLSPLNPSNSSNTMQPPHTLAPLSTPRQLRRGARRRSHRNARQQRPQRHRRHPIESH